MNVARLNFSHGDHEEHGQRIKNIREAASSIGKNVAILLDTKGPEIRTHTMENRVSINICGQEYTFIAEESASYMHKVGAYVDGKMSEVLRSARVGRTDAAVRWGSIIFIAIIPAIFLVIGLIVYIRRRYL